MDFEKCFNNIKWTCGYNLLKEIGIPPGLLRIWIHSLANICRYWVLQGGYFQAGTSTGGFPEGDSWSVIVIVALATAWVCFLENTIPIRAQPRLSAHADNWSWTLQDIIGHHVAMANTCLFTHRNICLLPQTARLGDWFTWPDSSSPLHVLPHLGNQF